MSVSTAQLLPNETPYFYTVYLSTEDNLSLRDSKYNRAAEKFMQSPIIHVEFYFPLGFQQIDPQAPPGPASFSVLSMEEAQFKFGRSMEREWKTLRHNVSFEVYRVIYELLLERVGMGFDTRGFWCALRCATTAWMRDDYTFCSRLVSEVMLDSRVRLLKHEEVPDPREATPPLLYNILKTRASHSNPLQPKLDKMTTGALFLGSSGH